jgi:hypothetical protein
MKYFLYLYDGIKTGYIDYNENISRIDVINYDLSRFYRLSVIKSFVSFSPLRLIWKDIFLIYGPRFVSLTHMN